MTDASTDTSRISPTAHYTGHVWYRNGLSHDAFATPLGKRLYRVLQPANLVYRRMSGNPDLEQNLLARHRLIDQMLADAIADGRVKQVVEVAAGLSPRGFRFAQRYPDVTYVEGDLPDMIATKRARLDGAGLRGPNHHVVEINALVDDGPAALSSVAADLLEPDAGTAIITEGLTGYFDLGNLEGMWRRFAVALDELGGGMYLSDIILGDRRAGIATRSFKRLLSMFAKGETYLHYGSTDECAARLRDSGFTTAALHDAPGGHLVRIVHATV